MNKLKKESLKEEFSISNIHVIHDVLIAKSNKKTKNANSLLMKNITQHSRIFYYHLDFQKNISRAYLPEYIVSLLPYNHIYSFPDNGFIRNNKLQIFLDKSILKKEAISIYFQYEKNDLTYIGFGKNNNVCEAFDSITKYDNSHIEYLDEVLMNSQIDNKTVSIKKIKVLKF